jgi:hypothetical protein
MEMLTANNSDEAAAAQLEANRDEIRRIEDSSVPVSRPTELNHPTPANNNDSGPITPLRQHQQASDVPLPSSPFIPFIGLEQITGDDEASVPLSQQTAAINNEKSDHKSRVGLEQITGNDEAPAPPLNFGDFEDSSNLNVAADFVGVHDGDESILPTNQQDSMGNTEPTRDSDMQMSTTPSDAPFENATYNERNNLLNDEESRNEHLLIEAYLVNEDEDILIYDATPELPWWRQRRTRILLLVICILLSSMAALLPIFVRDTPPPTASPTASPTTSMSPSSSPHTSYKVSLSLSWMVLLLLHYEYGCYSRIFLIHYLFNFMPEFPDLLSEQE